MAKTTLVSFNGESPNEGEADPTFGRKRSHKFYNESTSLTIALGDWVAVELGTNTFGVGQSAQQAPSSSQAVVGVAEEAIPPESWGLVTTYGYVDNANVDAGVAAGDGLIMSATAGRAEAVAALTDNRCGIALEAAVANQAAVFVTCE